MLAGTADATVPGRDGTPSPVRPPQEIAIESWDGSAWAAVTTIRRTPGVLAGHRANVLAFEPLDTSRLRLRLIPRPGFQVGLAELEAWGSTTVTPR
jgi:hypothetical protein